MIRRFAIAAIAPLACSLLLISTAEAHVFGAAGAGLSQGLSHPFSGLDHLLTMVAVGLWAGQNGGRAIWLVPGAFVTMMVIGAVSALAGIPLLAVESGIALSVIVLGLLIGFQRQLPIGLGMLIVGGFAVFHGHAHGAEMPEALHPALYGLGFVLATIALHAIGVAMAQLTRTASVPALVRAAGFLIAAAGTALLVAV